VFLGAKKKKRAKSNQDESGEEPNNQKKSNEGIGENYQGGAADIV